MSDKEIVLRKLETFRKRKHNQNAFIDVDLDRYQDYVDGCVLELVESVENDATEREKKIILRRYLKYLRQMGICETVEREYVTQEFYELSQIVGVNVSFHLNMVIYGFTLTAITTIMQKLRPKPKDVERNDGIVEKFEIICEECQYHMPGRAAFYESDNHNDIWIGKAIVSCPVCGGYNLVFFEDRDGYQGFVDGDYRVIENLDAWPTDHPSQKKYWTREDAEQRLQQVKYWRKN